MVFGARVLSMLSAVWFFASVVITILVAYWVYSAQARLTEILAEIRASRQKTDS